MRGRLSPLSVTSSTVGPERIPKGYGNAWKVERVAEDERRNPLIMSRGYVCRDYGDVLQWSAGQPDITAFMTSAASSSVC
jgi:hypothetical protein